MINETILAIIISFAISAALCPVVIPFLHKLKFGQQVRSDGPQSHLSKSGTPTMGGALILVAIAAATLLWADLSNQYVWIVLLVTLGFGVVGWMDDWLKISKKNTAGLPARWKYFWQSVIGLTAAVLLYKPEGLFKQ